MCWMCDDPTMTKDGFLERMADLVERFGWAINAVEGDRMHAPWAYTVGLTPMNLPELVITGLPSGTTHPLLNQEAHRFVHDGLPGPGGRVTLTDGRDAEVVSLPHPDAHLLTAVGLFGDYPFAARQLVWADDRGRWPWELGFRGRRGGQPVLGPRAR